MSAQRGRVRLRPPRRQIVNVDSDEEANISFLCSFVQEWLTNQKSESTFEVLYRCAYKVVLKKKAEALNQRISTTIKDWLIKEVKPSVANLCLSYASTIEDVSKEYYISNKARTAGQHLLLELRREWERYDDCVNVFCDVFMYMDRSFYAGAKGGSMYESLQTCFRDTILCSQLDAEERHPSTIQAMTTYFIVKQIELERIGEIIDRRLMESCIGIFLNDSGAGKFDQNNPFYVKTVEPIVLQKSQDFFDSEVTEWLAHSAPTSYTRQINRRLLEEQEICGSIFPATTAKKIRNILKQERVPETTMA